MAPPDARQTKTDVAELERRFADALRRALDGPQPGAVHVDVAAPNVTFTPVVKAELPALAQPFEVVDVRRYAGAWEYEVRPVRDADGFMISARLVPVALVHFGELP
jgi:hypothetical protein